MPCLAWEIFSTARPPELDYSGGARDAKTMNLTRQAPSSNSATTFTGLRIRELRDRRGDTREELALRSRTHPTSLARIERGQGNPSLSTLTQIASALGTTVADLVRDVPCAHGSTMR